MYILEYYITINTCPDDRLWEKTVNNVASVDFDIYFVLFGLYFTLGVNTGLIYTLSHRQALF